MAGGAVAGGAAGFQAGASLSPYLATIPGVGPALAAAAPVVGGTIGGVIGGIKGYNTPETVTPEDTLMKVAGAGASYLGPAGKHVKKFGPEMRSLAAASAYADAFGS